MTQTGTQVVQAKPEPQAGTAVRSVSWDPFSIMDRLDEELIVREMEGIAANELVYRVKDKRTGREEKALTKVGVDEACNYLATMEGHVLREEKIEHDIFEDRGEAYIRVLAARYAVAKDGSEVRLDMAWGVKRQPMYYEGQELSLDVECRFKKHKGETWRQVLEKDRSYVEWVAGNVDDEDLRGFAAAILDGEAPVLESRRLNPFWYEAGVMKAARNARSRLVGAKIKAQIMAMAERAGRVREVGADGRDVRRDDAAVDRVRERIGRMLVPLMDPQVWDQLAQPVKDTVNVAEAIKDDPATPLERLLNAADYMERLVAHLPESGGSKEEEAERPKAGEHAGPPDTELDRLRREYFHRVGELGWDDDMRKRFQKENKVYSVRYARVEGMKKLLDALAKHEGKAD